jgi:hypothetical protein
MCQRLIVDTWTAVNFWTDILSPSLAKANVSFAIQNKPLGAKNKRLKPQEIKMCLSRIFILKQKTKEKKILTNEGVHICNIQFF